VIRVQRKGGGAWQLKRDRHYARRITGTSPRIRMTGAGVGDPGDPSKWAPVPGWTDGSVANCAGGISAWGTALSAEENWADYATTYGWGPDFAAVNNGGIGWVLEVDPMDPDWTPRKHTNLGRLRHENATVWAREGKHLVVYTGDDARDKFLYKYVSSGRYRRAAGRRNSRLFEDGQLWVAEFAPTSQDEAVLAGTGRWHKVDMSPQALVDPDTWVRAQSWFDPATPTAASGGWPRRAATPPPTPSPGRTSRSAGPTRRRPGASPPPTTWCSTGSATCGWSPTSPRARSTTLPPVPTPTTATTASS
jgi:secreted PhoX family phosphatase